ncbi:MAG: ABC transporter substrate-binding protein [Synergistaceae bacterium]|nr:ABC transporter substrate-binding protein [Synergistaceae bacterium]
MKKNFKILLMILVVLLVVTACSGGSKEIGTEGDKDTVRVYCEGVWTTLDPHGTGANAYTNMYLSNQFYESLVYVNDGGEIEPVLATEWSVSDDGLEYIFKLREGVKFHDSEEMTASDVVYSFERAISEPTLETYYAPIAKVEEINEYEVKITLKEIFAPFVSYMEYIPIVSEKYASENSLLTTECGTGAYELVSIDLNTECKMKAFDDYWRGKASIENAIFQVITEGTSAVVALESGDIDFMFCYNVSAFKPLEESGNFNTSLTATFHTANILMNNKVAPLDNKLVRQALSYATDRDAMIEIAYEGLAAPTYLMANPSAFGVSEEQFYNRYEFDLDKAKTLLAEAGFPDGLDLGKMTVISGSYHEKYAQVWQESLAKIGVKVELEGSESAVADATEHNYITCTMGNGFSSDFAYNSSHYTPDNMANYDNAEVTRLFAEAAKELDEEKRKELYSQVIDIIYDECPNIPIFNKQIPWVWNKDLNANPHLNSGHPYYIFEMSWNE